MTVIIFARASNGYVIASDGRTCRPSFPRHIKTDDAEKIRVFPIGDGGYVTASSGRATIGNVSIATVEKSFVQERIDSGVGIAGPEEFISYFVDALKQFNEGQQCDCSTMLYHCVTCQFCEGWDRQQCENCTSANPVFVWSAEGDFGEKCWCSPGEGRPAGTPSTSVAGCECKPTREDDLTWLCVPFGPRAVEPVTATVPSKPNLNPRPEPIIGNVLLMGELASGQFATETEELVKMANNGFRLDVEASVVLARAILQSAYAEASNSAVLHASSDFAEELNAMSFNGAIGDSLQEWAEITRKLANSQGWDADERVGAAGIGGTARVVAINDSDGAKMVETSDNFGLPSNVCPIHSVGPCQENATRK